MRVAKRHLSANHGNEARAKTLIDKIIAWFLLLHSLKQLLMREIVFDTETTGMDPATGHRIVELGCVEIFNYRPTGKSFQSYLNPQRDMPEGAARVHGLTAEFLADKPLFIDVVEDFLNFIGESPLVIHNAGFDMKFINAELTLAGFAPLPLTRARDTLQLARNKYPGQPASLDALCRRFGVNNAGRNVHGALLDSELLADVYFHLMGGAQPELFDANLLQNMTTTEAKPRAARVPRQFMLPPDEAAAHAAMVVQLGDKALWQKKAS